MREIEWKKLQIGVIMKFGALKDGSGCYAAQYNQDTKRVEIIDTDADLFTLMERHGFVTEVEIIDTDADLFTLMERHGFVTDDNDDDGDDDDDNEDIFSDIK